MLEGMQVRVHGAVAGSIGTIEVDDQGLADVTLLVEKTIPSPRSDAKATIRQLDSTGDSYIDYDPGSEGGPLRKAGGKPTIACDAPRPGGACTNTLAAPRFDDLLNAFGPPEQAGVKLILQNLSDALAQRGEDVNRAALTLVPALDAANEAVTEVNGQNTALKALIRDMEAVSGQAASRRVELGRLIGSLSTTLGATAATAGPLDAGLEALPATEERLRSMLRSLTKVATRGAPAGERPARRRTAAEHAARPGARVPRRRQRGAEAGPADARADAQAARRRRADDRGRPPARRHRRLRPRARRSRTC